MTKLQRLTSEYVDSEDRIRLSGAGADGQTVVLWVTRRLLDRLIPHLTLWLEKQHGNLPRADVLLEFAQQQAQSQLVPQAPVTAGTSGQLVQAIDLSPGVEQIHLNFRTAAVEAAGIGFAATPLRQWLAILHQAYRSGDWPLTCWPTWLTESVAPTSRMQATQWH